MAFLGLPQCKNHHQDVKLLFRGSGVALSFIDNEKCVGPAKTLFDYCYDYYE